MIKKILIIILFLFIFTFFPFNSIAPYSRANEQIMDYSERELKILKDLGTEIEKEYDNATAILVEKIVSQTLRFKFDTPPIIYENRALIPVRAVTESLEANVAWYPKDQMVSIQKESIHIILLIDNKKVTVNEKEIEIDVPAKIFKNRTYVPLRFIAEEFDLDVQYSDETGVITLNKEEVSQIDKSINRI